MKKPLTPQAEYRIDARVFRGSHAEKLEQIESAIQELLEIKMRECAAEQPNVRFLAVPRRSHAGTVFVLVLALLVLFAWVLGSPPAHANHAGWHASSSSTPPPQH